MYVLLSLSVLLLKAAGKHIEDQPTSVIKGVHANIEQYPYYAFLSIKGELHCGGAIIQKNIILTAAHCLTPGADIKVYTGMTVQSDKSDENAYKVKRMLVHPNYASAPTYDIGLIVLTSNIAMNDKVEVVDIAATNPIPGTNVSVVGFGYEDCTNGFMWMDCFNFPSDHLKVAVVTVMKYGGDGTMYTIGNDTNTCYGDSGSPLVYDGQVVGVVSSGETRECKGYDVQAPVARVYDWIQHYMNIYAI